MADIFVFENLFLIAVALIWVTVASIQDIRKREVANWWNFSFIIIVLAYRAFLSVALLNYWYLLWGVIGLGIGFGLANAFYYGRMFAGGDAKLLMALGAVLPLSLSWLVNLQIFFWFLVLFLFAGAIYGGIYSIVLAVMHKKNFRIEFSKCFDKYKSQVVYVSFVALIGFVASFLSLLWVGIWLSLLLFFSPWLLIYAKAVEESCMIKSVKTNELAVGDWLVKSIKAGRKKIEPNWQGISEDDLELIRKSYRGKVLIKYGIPFVPTFLIGLIGVLIIFKYLNSMIPLW